MVLEGPVAPGQDPVRVNPESGDAIGGEGGAIGDAALGEYKVSHVR